jgi:DNA replication ATP-dependent helicase Dna2
MGIDLNSHISFYNTEITTLLKDWELFLSKQIKQLLSEKKLYIGRIISYNSKSGDFQLKFRKSLVPRQYTQYFIGLIGPKAIELGDPFNWEFTYDEFRKSERNGFWGDRIGGEISTNQCFKVDKDWAYFNISIPEPKLALSFKKILESIEHPLVLITQTDPPIQYLKILCEFVKSNPQNLLNNITVDYNIEAWKPILVDNEKPIHEEILNWIKNNDLIVIQGPPGTGKSYNAALVCNQLIQENKSVCICSLANKALIEIASQPGLQFGLNNGRVYKTNLSEDEQKRIPDLISFDGQLPKSASVLLATYYKLSELTAVLIQNKSRFDVIIIEEASQAFLATIGLFSTITEKLIIIGDYMQLPPVVRTSESKLLKIDEKILGVINGMATVASYYEKKSYRLINTSRLTHKATKQTGLFYEGTLKSSSNLNNTKLHSGFIEKLFDNQGGTSILKLPVAHPAYQLGYVKDLISKSVFEIFKTGDFSIAILTQTKDLEVELTQELVYSNKTNDKLTISTVHKIQGITVDYAFLYLPLKNVEFELGENFFNVATSRAKRGTVIITFQTIDLQYGIKYPVLKFLESSKKIDLKEINI